MLQVQVKQERLSFQKSESSKLSSLSSSVIFSNGMCLVTLAQWALWHNQDGSQDHFLGCFELISGANRGFLFATVFQYLRMNAAFTTYEVDLLEFTDPWSRHIMFFCYCKQINRCPFQKIFIWSRSMERYAIFSTPTRAYSMRLWTWHYRKGMILSHSFQSLANRWVPTTSTTKPLAGKGLLGSLADVCKEVGRINHQN